MKHIDGLRGRGPSHFRAWWPVNAPMNHASSASTLGNTIRNCKNTIVSMAMMTDGTYHILIGDRPQRRITLRVLATQPTDDDVLTKLHELGCKQQFEAWVRERVATRR